MLRITFINFLWTLFVENAYNLKRNGTIVVLESPNKMMIEQFLRFDFKANKNQEMYKSLMVEMVLAQEMRVNELHAKSNS